MNPTDFDAMIDGETPLRVPAGAPLTTPLPASLLKLRRELKRFVQAQTSVINDLSNLQQDKPVGADSGAFAALAAMAAQLRYPTENADNPLYCRALQQAENGSLHMFVDEASDEVAAIIRIVEKGRAGLDLLDALGLPLPSGWSNLPAASLARAINNHCHAVFGSAVIR